MASDRTLTAKIPPFGLRLQPELKAQLEEHARANERSLNSEIAARLDGSLRASSEAPLIFSGFADDVAAVARVSVRLYETKSPPWDIVVVNQELANRIAPRAEAAKRSVHDEILALLDEEFPKVDGPTMMSVASTLRLLLAEEKEPPEPLLAFLRTLEEKISENPQFGERRL